MRTKLTTVLISLLLGFSSFSFAQAIYDAQGQYKGYSQTSPSGVTNVYNANGQNTQSFQTDMVGHNFHLSKNQLLRLCNPSDLSLVP